jgi:hypothetical protein
MLRAIAAAKRKNDKIDAGKIADCLRCDFLPECHMEPHAEADGPDEESHFGFADGDRGATTSRLHKLGYFTELISGNDEVNDEKSGRC